MRILQVVGLFALALPGRSQSATAPRVPVAACRAVAWSVPASAPADAAAAQDFTAIPAAIPFTPNFIPYPLGADLRSLSQPLAPDRFGVPAEIFDRHGKKRRNPQ